MSIFLLMVAVMFVLAAIIYFQQSPSPGASIERAKNDPGGAVGAITVTAIGLFVFFTVIGFLTQGCKGQWP